MNKIENIIFDLDGTLWNSTEASLEGWNLVAESDHEFAEYTVTKELLNAHFGLPIDAIAESLLSGLNGEKRQDFLDKWYVAAQKLIVEDNRTFIYPKLEQTLMRLSENHGLYIVSNCEAGYIESFYEAHGLEKYFKDYEYWGRTLLPKSGSIITLINRNALTNCVYVGDTKTDCIAAREAGIPFVYAEYGFGKSDDYDEKITEFSQLTEIFC